MLEKLTGQPLQDLASGRVVRPLHLHGTFLATSARFRGAYAHGYLPPSLTGAGYLDTSSWHPSFAWASGALVPTAPDLARFYQALLSGRLLSPPLLQAMTTTVTDPGYPGWGYGLRIYSLEAAVAIAVCQMFDHHPSLASRSAGASTMAARPLPPGPPAPSWLRPVG